MKVVRVAVLILTLLLSLTGLQPLSLAEEGATPDSLTRLTKPFKGDLDTMLEDGRPVRVLVSYNRTNFFMDKGKARGLEADNMRAFEEYLEKRHPKSRVRLAFVPVPFEELLSALREGKGDVAAAGLTVTPERERIAAFSAPYRDGVTELVVGNGKSTPIRTLADLSGKTLQVLAGSSYVDHLNVVNRQLADLGMKPVKVVEADPMLVTENLLEMVNNGIIDYTVAEAHLIELWKSLYTKLVVYDGVPVHTDGQLAWAVRPGAVQLLRELNGFVGRVREGSTLGNLFFKRYYKNDQWVKNPLTDAERAKLNPMAKLFRKYAKEYDFDWLKIAAMAYQESRFDMDVKSHVGAVGVMQVLPSTAAGRNVGIDDVHTLDGNIHAGVKYLRFLIDTYFSDVEPNSRTDFALAAYNAGPARIRRLRSKAKAMGLDPDRWFGNVEWAAYDDIGRETPDYVAHIQMYYAAYKASLEVLEEREEAL